MRFGIVGSRDYPTLQDVIDFVNQLPPDAIVVSGGARGVDKTAEIAAKQRNLPSPEIYEAEWDKHGKAAGYIRNKIIVDKVDVIVSFWDGISRGTAHTMNLALQANKPVYCKMPNRALQLV